MRDADGVIVDAEKFGGVVFCRVFTGIGYTYHENSAMAGIIIVGSVVTYLERVYMTRSNSLL